MIRIDVYEEEGLITGFKAQGHADNNPEGYDLLCAAVSILTQTCIESLHRVAGLAEEDLPYQMEDGFLSISLSKTQVADPTIQTIFSTLLCGLSLIQESAPGDIIIRR